MSRVHENMANSWDARIFCIGLVMPLWELVKRLKMEVEQLEEEEGGILV